MNAATRYIYAIIPTSDTLVFDVAGMEDDVYTVSVGGLAAVVSGSPREDYRGLKRDEAVRYLMIHQSVVEAVMADHPTLPVKFGTTLPDETWVRRLLTQGEGAFRGAFAQLAGHAQVEVVVLWDLQRVFLEISQEDAIMRLKDRIAGQPSDVSASERVALGQMVQAILQQRRATLQETLLPALQEAAHGVALHPLMDDSMVLNLAMLLDDAGRAALDRRLDDLDGRFGGQLTFRRVGPLPPYSFATVETRPMTFDEVERARDLLQLPEATTLGDMKRAYRRAAALVHPDHNRADAEAEARLTELTNAYRLLYAYALSQPACTDQDSEKSPARIDCARPAVERTLLLAMRREGAGQ